MLRQEVVICYLSSLSVTFECFHYNLSPDESHQLEYALSLLCVIDLIYFDMLFCIEFNYSVIHSIKFVNEMQFIS